MTEIALADITNDGIVDLADLMVLWNSWLYEEDEAGFCHLGNFNGDDIINNSDVDMLADYFGSKGNEGFYDNSEDLYVRQYYYHFDQLGSVIALSDEEDTVVETYKYDVFGNRTSF